MLEKTKSKNKGGGNPPPKLFKRKGVIIVELTKADVLRYAVDGADRELKSVRKVFGVDHKNHKRAEEVYHTLHKLYQKERIKNLAN